MDGLETKGDLKRWLRDTLINEPGLVPAHRIMGLNDVLETLPTDLATHEADTTNIHGIADTSALATATSVATAVSNHDSDTSVHGIADTTVLATDGEVATAVSDHSADTTSVHGISDTTVLATDAEVATAVSDHSADTTSVHGIPDTAAIATATSVATAVSNHEADTSNVHGITDTTVLATDSEVATAVSDHSADTTSVHGITDTAVLATATSVATAVSNHEADTTSVHGIADTSVLATATSVATAVSNHEADTTSVHGIADTTVLDTVALRNTAISNHEADTTSVHGITDTSTLYRSGGTDVAVADGGTGASTPMAGLANLGIRIVYKSADESVNNSNTPQADDHLKFAIGVSETWFAEAHLILTGASTVADWLFGWSGPTGATASWGPLSSAAATVGGTFIQTAVGNSPGAVLAIGGTVSHGGINGTAHMALAGWFFADASNAGDITFKWSQNTPTVENNTIKTGSFLRATRLV